MALSNGQMYDWEYGVNPTINPDLSWKHPDYAGVDPAYLAWQAQQDEAAREQISQAKLRRAQLNESYRNALADMDRQAVFGRRNIQTGMLQRGLFRSGETDRRQSEFDTQVDQGKINANRALQDQIGQIDLGQSNFMAGLSSQAASQVSQAMLRDALAQYQAQQEAAATPTAAPPAAPAFSAPPQQAAPKPKPLGPQGHTPNYNPKPPAHPAVTDSTSLYQAQSKKPYARSRVVLT